MTPQETKEVVFISIVFFVLSFAIGSFAGWNYGTSEGQKEFDKYVKQAREAQSKAEEAQNEALRIQGEARRILMEARQ